MFDRLRRRWRALGRKRELDSQLAEELDFHLERLVEQNIKAGMDPAAARSAARRQFGGVEQATEKCREARGVKPLEDFWQDLRFGARTLRKNWGFSFVAVLTLALGIGATTAIFSVVNAALLRPLPYDATRLVALQSYNTQKGDAPTGISPADFWDWKGQSQTFEQLAAYSGGGVGLKTTERVEIIPGTRVTTNFFETFGARPLAGRTFTEEEGLLGGPRAIVLSHRVWQKRFGGDSSIIGRALNTDDGTVTVVGVMPPDLKYPGNAEVWTPLARDSGEMKFRANRYFQAVGRISPGRSFESAQAELQTISARLAADHPKENQGWTVQLADWRDSLVPQNSRRALLILLGAVGLVLLIACANVANLLLSRAASRRKEMAVRLALGSGRWRLMRQLLTESLLLSLTGGLVGLVLAFWGVGFLIGLLPEQNFTFQSLTELREDISVDRIVLLFTLLISILTGLIFGLAPGWQTVKINVNDSLKESPRGGGGDGSVGRQRTRRALVVAEIALALTLLAGAGLLINSFLRLLRVDPGYDPEGLMTMALSFPAENKNVFARQVLERVAATPGVSSVALMSFPTLGGLNFPFNREGHPFASGDVTVAYSAISPPYFRTLKTPLRSGREFDDGDRENSRGVAIINETLARQYFAGEDPIGQEIAIAYLNRRVTREIVGVVGDIKQGTPDKPTSPEIFVPFAQLPWFSGTLLVRSINPDPLTVRNGVQQAIWSVNPALPESTPEPLTETLAGQVAEPRLYALLLGVFSVIALALAAVGIYSVITFTVAQRTHEIGVRMALGARKRDVLKLVVGQGLTLALCGIGLGLAAAFAFTRLLKSLLFGVGAFDSATLAIVSLLMLGVALLACYLPARRAAEVDPMVALRYE